MRLTVIILLTTCMQVSATGYGQKPVTLNEKSANLGNVLEKIRKQTGIVFWYRSDLLEKAKPVTIQVQNMPVQEVLNQVFKDQPFSYVIQGNSVFVKLKAGTISIKDELKPPPGDIKGRVVNEKGEPVEGVTIKLKGTDRTTVTDRNGEFSMGEVDPSAVLVFTHISMEPVEFKVNGKTELVINLKTKVSALGDVIVTMNTGYQQVEKERVVGSYTKIDSALFNRQVSTDLISRLDGIANSVLFDKRGTESRIQIRGISTIFSNQNPLIILDNFPFNGDINNINPNDISDVTILKDAAAASIWGARAGNGVIVITTKKGRYNQPLQVSVRSNVSVLSKPDLYYFPQMSSSDFVDVEKSLFSQGFYDNDLNDTYSWPIISPVVEILAKQRDGKITQAEADAQINALQDHDVRNDIKKYQLRNAINQQNHISFIGGSNQLNYNFSAGYDRNITGYKGPGEYKRYTINSNMLFKPVKFLEINAGIEFSRSNQMADGSVYPITIPGKGYIYPYAQLADVNGNPLAIPNGYRLALIDSVSAMNNKLLDWYYRPLEEAQLVDNRTTSQLVLVNLGTTIKLASFLNMDLKYQYTQQTDNNRNYNSLDSYLARNLVNRFSQVNGSQLSYTIPLGGILDLANNEITTQNFRAQLNFNKTRGDHQITALVASEISDSKRKTNSHRVYGYNEDIMSYSTNIDFANYLPNFFGNYEQIPNPFSINESVNKVASFLGNATYTFRNKYNAYASFRRDGSNLLGAETNNKWKPLWSAGASWEIARESFYDIGWMPGLNVRASYGYTGNINNTIPSITTIGYLFNSPFTNITYAQAGDPPNPDLRWEQVNIFNAGVDFSLFKGGITGSFQWFVKKAKDVIAPYPVDPTSGLSNSFINVNAANLKGKGFDANLAFNNQFGAFRWRGDINMSYAKTIVTKYYQNPLTISQALGNSINPAEGQVAFGLYSYKWAGLDPATGDPQGYLGKDVSKDYLSILNDSLKHAVFHGSSLPLYFGNFMNTFSWKNISLSANITYRFAYYYRKPSIDYSALFSTWSTHADYTRRWQQSGDEQFTNVPSMIYPANPNRDLFYNTSEVNVEKADNIRLQDVRLSYDFTNRKRALLPFKGFQFYLYASNLNIIIWKASESGIDPDFGNAFILPSKSYAAGININL